MKFDVSSDINRDYFRAKFLRYTRKAFQILPKLDKPHILDIGCSSGVVTLELARLSNGQVIGIDSNQTMIDKLNQKIKQAGLVERVKTMNCSMKDMKFPDAIFDIIWSEGSIFVIGFEEGLKTWRRFIKPEGFLVIHARIVDIRQRVELIPTCGYTLIDNFIVSKDIWWNEYYNPLEKLINDLHYKYRNSPEALALLAKEQNEVNEFKSNPEYHGSVFYITQKTEEKYL